MLNCEYSKKVSNLVLQGVPNNSSYLILLVKMASCGACKRYLPDWDKLKSQPNLQASYTFLQLDSQNENDNPIINQLSDIGEKHYKSSENSPIIHHFPTILIFKKNNNINKYVFYEKFEYSREVLPKYLEILMTS